MPISLHKELTVLALAQQKTFNSLLESVEKHYRWYLGEMSAAGSNIWKNYIFYGPCHGRNTPQNKYFLLYLPVTVDEVPHVLLQFLIGRSDTENFFTADNVS